MYERAQAFKFQDWGLGHKKHSHLGFKAVKNASVEGFCKETQAFQVEGLGC